VDSKALIDCARRARENAYAPYSNFKVGAALLAGNGRVFTGCNVENATYGLTVCAERVALWKAISEGEREFSAIAVVSTSDPPASPCGACRQLLWEFCGDIEVTVANIAGVSRSYRMAQLFPHPFDRRLL
jgi:cytidine deaminase